MLCHAGQSQRFQKTYLRIIFGWTNERISHLTDFSFILNDSAQLFHISLWVTPPDILGSVYLCTRTISIQSSRFGTVTILMVVAYYGCFTDNIFFLFGYNLSASMIRFLKSTRSKSFCYNSFTGRPLRLSNGCRDRAVGGWPSITFRDSSEPRKACYYVNPGYHCHSFDSSSGHLRANNNNILYFFYFFFSSFFLSILFF